MHTIVYYIRVYVYTYYTILIVFNQERNIKNNLSIGITNLMFNLRSIKNLSYKINDLQVYSFLNNQSKVRL